MSDKGSQNHSGTLWLPLLGVVAFFALIGVVVVLLSSMAGNPSPAIGSRPTASGSGSTSSGGSGLAAGVPGATKVVALSTGTVKLAKATFAGGCFWSLESALEKKYGVISAVSGYTGGQNKNPTYENYHQNGHVEAVTVSYDPSRISYAELLDAYWRSTDPTDGGGAFYDRGPNYRPIIYYTSAAEKAAAEKSKAALAASGVFKKPIVAEIRMATTFYPAEEYHQDYAKKNPAHYEAYREASGRDEFFRTVWGAEAVKDHGLPPQAAVSGNYARPSDAVLKTKLTRTQFEVARQDGTEPAFDNAYAHSTGEGIYVDIVSGEGLFSSRDKYDSGTGWPSFTQALVPSNIVIRTDSTLGMVREEVRSRYADSHLGHVFDDGPLPTGRRFCMNSASMRFVPKAEMEAQGYGYFLKYFK